jgi:hypothetical protein
MGSGSEETDEQKKPQRPLSGPGACSEVETKSYRRLLISNK